MTNGAHLVIEQHIDEAVRTTIRVLVDPWLHFRTKGVNVRRFDGTEIAYSGIDFAGSPVEVFWSRNYIDPYLRAMVDTFVSTTSKTARDLGHDTGIVLYDLQGMLESGIHRVLERMAEVDQRLRGKGFPDSVSRQSIEARLIELNGYVAARVKVEYSVEQMHARTIMIQASVKASSLVDTYSSWLLAGLAAFVAVLITNQEKIKDLITPQTITICLVTLLATVLLGIIQKALAVIVAASGAGETVGRDLAERGEAVAGLSVVFKEVLQGALPPIRPLMRRRLVRVLSGDIAADGRSIFRTAQYQSVLVCIQMLLIVTLIGWMTYSSWLGEPSVSTPNLSTKDPRQISAHGNASKVKAEQPPTQGTPGSPRR